MVIVKLTALQMHASSIHVVIHIPIVIDTASLKTLEQTENALLSSNYAVTARNDPLYRFGRRNLGN